MTEPQRRTTFEKRLREVLESLEYSDKQTRVKPINARNYIGVVTTPDFEGLDEAERQRQIWEALHESFDDAELKRVEFIFTNTPAEEDEMEERDENE